MVDRPRNPGPKGPSTPNGDSDEPQFDWLYGPGGAGGDAAAPTGRPDETRMMRTQPRERPPVPPSGPARATAPPAGPVPRTLAPTPVEDPASRRSRSAGRRGLRRPRIGRLVLLAVVAWLVFLVVVPFLAWGQVDKASWEPRADRPAEQPGTTYLLVGSDSRAGLSRAERQAYNTGNPQENLADTIMLLHTGSGPNVLLSIPRDSEVDIPGYGTGKINGAFSRGGPRLLARTIEASTGVRIDDYVQIGLGGVAQVVDAVGGVEICPEYRMRDVDAGLNIRRGCQQADGEVALAYSRSRHAQRLGDLGRVKHQREVVAAVGKQVLSPWTVINPVRWWRLNHSMPDFFVFGNGMGKVGAGQWALAMARTSGTSGKTCTMPVTDGSATQWDPERAEPLLQAIIDDDTDQITADQCTPAGIVGAA